MTSTPVKNIGAATNGPEITVPGVRTSGKASFEAVWNRQTDRNEPKQTASENGKAVSKKDDAVMRDSLKSKDSHKNVVNQPEGTDRLNDVEETGMKELAKMDPREWEEAMEVLGTAAVELIQQIADTFGMSVEEVQDLIADLNMDELEVLQPNKLTELLLAAGKAEDMTDLLTNGELYQQYQSLMEQAKGLLDECSETLQTDAQTLVDAVLTQMEEPVNQEEALPIEVIAENGDSEEVSAEHAKPNQSENEIEQMTKGQSGDMTVGQPEHAEAGKQSGQENGHDAGNGQHANLFIQNLHTEQFKPQMTQDMKSANAWDADTQDIMRQIMDFMRIQIKPDMSDVEMQLHPEHLGSLQIHVASKGGVVTAEFVAQNESVKAALESQMIQLKENFAEQGVKVDAIEVTVQTHQFEQNLEQGRDRQQESQDRRTRTRRIQLDGPLDVASMGKLSEDEQLAAQMMEANGNTVDYTA